MHQVLSGGIQRCQRYATPAVALILSLHLALALALTLARTPTLTRTLTQTLTQTLTLPLPLTRHVQMLLGGSSRRHHPYRAAAVE